MTDVEHKVAIHRLAADRRAAGKPIWAYTIRLGNLFHDDALSFEEKRDGFVRIIKASSWYKSFDELGELYDLIDEIAHAEDVEHFDAVLRAVYDEADYDRAWITR